MIIEILKILSNVEGMKGIMGISVYCFWLNDALIYFYYF